MDTNLQVYVLNILSVPCPFEYDLVNADDTQFVQKVDAWSVNSGARGSGSGSVWIRIYC